jgi:tetratricopeptide (TPR) repeat protein
MILTSLLPDFSISKKARFLFAIFLLIFTFFTSSAQTCFLFDSTQQVMYREASQLKTISVKKKLLHEKTVAPSNLANLFIEDFSDFLAVIAISSKDAFEYYKTKNSERIEIFENASFSSPYIKFSLSEFYLHRAICRVLFNEKFKAVFDLKNALSYSKSNCNEYPLFELNYKTKSLLNIILGSIPPSFKWASGLISLKGDYKTGITELNRMLNLSYIKEDYNCFFPEILTYKVITTQQSSATTNESKQLSTYFSTLTVKRELPKNYILLYAWSDYLMKNGQNDMAIKVICSQQKDSGYIPFWPIEFIQGVALQNKLDKSCVPHFLAYIHGVRKGNYINACYQRLAWQSLLNNTPLEYDKYIQQINRSVVNTEQDQVALFEQQSQQKPLVPLLKARLLFDGGYYTESMEELTSLKTENLFNSIYQLEYYYRLARNYEKQENFTRAIYLFNKVIIDGSSIANYYAANAALNAGNICEQLFNKKQAQFYYKKCLSLSPNQYKESIHQKAKIGLERIR